MSQTTTLRGDLGAEVGHADAELDGRAGVHGHLLDRAALGRHHLLADVDVGRAAVDDDLIGVLVRVQRLARIDDRWRRRGRDDRARADGRQRRRASGVRRRGRRGRRERRRRRRRASGSTVGVAVGVEVGVGVGVGRRRVGVLVGVDVGLGVGDGCGHGVGSGRHGFGGLRADLAGPADRGGRDRAEDVLVGELRPRRAARAPCPARRCHGGPSVTETAFGKFHSVAAPARLEVGVLGDRRRPARSPSPRPR